MGAQGCESRNEAGCLPSHGPHHSVVCQRDLDCLPEACKETQSFPSQLPSQTAESEVAGQSAQHRDSRADRLSSVFTMLCKSQLRWDGHVTRMSDEQLHKLLLYGELQTGVRCHGGQKKRFKDTLKASMKDFRVDHNSWKTLAQDRSAWHYAIHKGAAAYEQQCIETAKTK